MLAKKSRFQMYFAMRFLLPDLNYIQLLYLSSELQRRNDFKGISVGTHYFVHYQPLPTVFHHIFKYSTLFRGMRTHWTLLKASKNLSCTLWDSLTKHAELLHGKDAFGGDTLKCLFVWRKKSGSIYN